MNRPKLEVADIFRRYGEAYRQDYGAPLSTAQRRVMTAIEVCRTAALGGHLERCDSCPYERPCYDSCRDRHCPKCQSLARAEWVEKRKAQILQTHYFHVVFTLPEQIAAIAYQNKDLVYGILFRATAATLSTIAADTKRLGQRSAFSPSCTPGDRICSIIPTYIVLSRVAESRPMAPGGFLAAPVSYTGAVVPVPPIVLEVSAGRFRRRPTQLLLFPRGTSRPAGFPSASRSGAQHEMGRLRQGAVRRTPASDGLHRPLHAPGRDFQSSDRGYRERAGYVQLARLPRQQSAEEHDSLGRGVHAPIPSPCSPQWVPPHSLLRLPGQSIPQTEVGALPATSGHDSLQRKLFPTAAMPGLS